MTSPIDTEANAPGTAARLPALGAPELSPAFLARVKECIETLLGRRGGSQWDRAVTFRDLYGLGLAAPGQQVLVLPAQGAPASGTPASQQIIAQVEAALRDSPAFKELMRRIGSAEDLESFPDEIRSQLQAALADVARQRQADIQTIERKVQTSSLSLASRLTEITAALDETAAGVRHFDAAYADGLKALSTSITQVSASIGDLGGVTVEEKFVAQGDSINGLQGQWSVKIQAGTDANPVIAGIALAVDDPVAGPGTSSMVFLADKFGFFTSGGAVMPFSVSGTTVYVNGDLQVGSSGKTLGTLTDDMINYVGEFTAAPAVSGYRVNDIYKNTTDGKTYILKAGSPNFWDVWLTSGTNGSTGATGPAGTRGTVQIVASGSSWSSTTATNAIISATGTSPINRDIVTITNNTSFTQTRFWDAPSASWLTMSAYIDGNLLVTGTLSAAKITTGTMSADRIDGGTITGSAINIGSGNFQVSGTTGLATIFSAVLARCSTSNSSLPGNASFTATSSGSGPAISVSGGSSGNAVTITGGANGIVQTGGGANYLKSVLAASDNVYDLGGASNRYANLYVSSGAINTSDANEKQQVRTLSEAEHAVAVRCKGLLRAFKFNDAVEKKGDGARWHFGVIAQEVKAAFEAEGLVAEDYAVLCYDSWPDQWRDHHPVYETRPGPDGEPQQVLVADGWRELVQPAGERYGVRYDELLAFMLAAL